MSDVRRRILERRARFVAAAVTLGASAGVLACEPMAQVCLEPMVDCDAGPRTIMVTVPGTLCAGDRFPVVAESVGYCGSDVVTGRTVFATSDAKVLVVDGSTAHALQPGTVTITALVDGREGSVTVTVERCLDAAPTDTGSSDTGPSDTGSSDTGPSDTGVEADAGGDGSAGDVGDASD